MNDRILGLDCSSVCIGWAIVEAGRPGAYGELNLKGDIAERCAQAGYFAAHILNTHAPALVVIEAPVARFAKAVIPQARVSGAILAVFYNRATLWQEVSNSLSKRVLAGAGGADKEAMMRAACKLIGRPCARLSTLRGKLWALDAEGVAFMSEDAADALGLALVGASMKIAPTLA